MPSRFSPAPSREPIASDGVTTFDLYPSWLKWFSQLWSVVDSLINSVGEDVGNYDTTLTVGTSAKTQIYNSPITEGLVVTLSTTNAFNGASFHIVRTAAATGAFNVSVGGLKNLAVGQWCDVEFNNSAWFLSRFGSL